MKGLLWKDFYMAARYCRAFLVIVAVFLGISFFGDDNLFFILYPMLIAGIIPMSLISYDERDKWNQYSGALPYSRAQLVSCKYLIGLEFGGVVFVISLAATAGRMAIKGYFSWTEFFFMATILLIVGLLGPSLLLPFVFKFGAEKGRIGFYVMIGLVCAVGAFLTGVGIQTNFGTESLLAGAGFPVMGILWVVMIGLYLLSWKLSIAFYQKREL